MYHQNKDKVQALKVLYYHQHFSTPRGSTGTRSYEFAQKLIQRGHEVTMVCGSYNGGNTGLSSAFTGGKRFGSVDGISVIEYDLSYSNSDGFLKGVLKGNDRIFRACGAL